MTHRPIAASARFLCIPFVLVASLGANVAIGQTMNHGSEAMQKSMMSGMEGMKQMKMSANIRPRLSVDGSTGTSLR